MIRVVSTFLDTSSRRSLNSVSQKCIYHNVRFFLESREFGESRVYQVWSPNPNWEYTTPTLITKTDFSVVSLRKSVAVRFLYQTGASRHNWAQLRSLVTSSTVMYSEEGERKNLLTAFEKQKIL